MKELLYILIFSIAQIFAAWQDEVPINSHLSQDKLNGRFLGKFRNHEKDHLSLLGWSSESILIGARDALFNLTSRDLKINSVLNWTVSEEHMEMCQVKGQKDSDCHNFIRVVHGPIHHHHTQTHNQSNNSILEEHALKWIVCGTNAFKPRCRLYDENLGQSSHEFPGVGYSPFDPTHMSTSVLHHGAVYAGTVADFGGSDSLIYKNPMRTEQNDLRHLSSPSFVSSLSYGELALFFFRELAVEHTNCGKVVYSRVGRICRHDSGSKKHKDRFTTFLKARLNCSVPGEFPFYFDYIQGTSSVFLDNEQSVEMLYAVFTTGDNSIGASAICSFPLPSILNVFEGSFKGQSSANANWLPVPPGDVPTPRPGACPGDPSRVPDIGGVNFHKVHPLMDEAVQGKLAFVFPSNSDKLRVIEVDHSPDVDFSRAASSYHILYIGTESGKVLKVIVDNGSNSTLRRGRNIHSAHGNSSPRLPTPPFSINNSYVSAQWQISTSPIKSLKLLNGGNLLVGTETDYVVVPVKHCELYRSCSECIKLRDPHCYWDMNNEECRGIESVERGGGQFDLRQDLQNGDDQFCPIREVTKKDETTESMNTIPPIRNESPECCPCTISPPTNIGTNRIPELDGEFRYLGGISDYEKPIIFGEIDISGEKRANRRGKDFESSSVKSDGVEGQMSKGSIAMATAGSAFLSLLIGVLIGYGSARWVAKKKRAEKSAATNAQLAVSMHEQAQRLTNKPIDYVMNLTSDHTLPRNTLKHNLNTDTLEKTVKKIYL